MFRRSLQLLTLALVAALAVSSQCYAMCAAAACTASSPHAAHCHHHSEKSNGSGQTCQHQHSDFFGPERGTDVAKLAVLHFAGVLALPCAESISAVEVQPAVEILQIPGRNQHRATSVLALLSTFRI